MLRRLGLLLVSTALLFGMLAAPAGAHGQNAERLDNAGWDCFVAGPHDWTHCAKPVGGGNKKATNVMVFGVGGHPFLGTEMLLDASVYHGQLCRTDPVLGVALPYHDLSGTGDGPYACHHFDTPDL